MSRGSIEKQPSGSYRARWRTPEGGERSKNFPRKREAEAQLTFIDNAKRTGSYIDKAAGQVRFKVYAEQWREMQVHRQSTAAQVETNLRRHVYPRIGMKPMGSIRASDIQALVKSLVTPDENGGCLAPTTIEVIYNWIAAIFKAAVVDRVVHSSPCIKIRLPEVHRMPVKPMSIEMVESIVEAVPDPYKALVLLGAGTGVRISEALGITLDRVDFLHREVTIDRQLVGTQDGEPAFGPVKDRRNRPRTIPLPDVVLVALSEHLSRWPTSPGGLVFRNKQGQPIRRTTFSDIWRKAVGPLGIQTGKGFHELRHLYASLLIASGASVKVVQERLGHSTSQMTLDTYAHLWPDSDDTTRGAVDAMFEGTSCVRSVSDMGGAGVNPLVTGVVTVSRPVGGIQANRRHDRPRHDWTGLTCTSPRPDAPDAENGMRTWDTIGTSRPSEQPRLVGGKLVVGECSGAVQLGQFGDLICRAGRHAGRSSAIEDRDPMS